MNKPGLDVMIGVGRPKAPRPPSGMSGPMPPDDGMPEGQPDDEAAESDRLGKIEQKLDKICEALGIDAEQYGDSGGKMPMGETEGAEA